MMLYPFPINSSSTKQLVVIDPGVDHPEVLAQGLIDNAQALILNPQEDSIGQITKALSQGNYDSLHIIAHGSAGTIHFSDRDITAGDLAPYNQQLMEWAVKQIHFYSCNLAQESQLLTEIHQLTQASIASSSKEIGNGNWQLEYQIGAVNNHLPFTSETTSIYQGIFSFTETNFSFGSEPLSATIGNLDGDGNVDDLTVANINSNNESILINNRAVYYTAPVVTPSQIFNYNENQSPSFNIGTVLGTAGITSFVITAGNDDGFFDIDNSGNLTLTATGATSAANDFETGANEFTLTIEASDTLGNTSAGETLKINVTNVNEPPEVVNPIPDQFINIHQIVNLNLRNTFTDGDGDPLSVSVSGLPSWLTFIFNSRNNRLRFTGVPLPEDEGSATIEVTADDGSGASVMETFTINVAERRIDPAEINRTIDGDSGRNRLDGGGSREEINGYGNSDIINGNGGDDLISGGDGIDRINAGGANDIANGDVGNDIVQGGTGNDYLFGSLGRDYLFGENGSDVLDGGEDDDFLFGGLGRDVLIGGSGNNNLSGNEGADVFILSEEGFDRISDFEDRRDRFRLAAGLEFSDLNINQISSSTFNIEILNTNQLIATVSLVSGGNISSRDFL